MSASLNRIYIAYHQLPFLLLYGASLHTFYLWSVWHSRLSLNNYDHNTHKFAHNMPLMLIDDQYPLTYLLTFLPSSIDSKVVYTQVFIVRLISLFCLFDKGRLHAGAA